MIAMFAAAATALFLQGSSAWAVGQEREVDQGVYMTLQAEQDGWRLWRIETASGVECRAAKSAVGQGHAAPAGYEEHLDGPVPRTEISAFVMPTYGLTPPAGPQVSQDWYGTHGFGTTQFRAPGDRFFRPIESLRTHRSGLTLIEINNVSYEYPRIYHGRSELNATFDLTGIEWAEAQVLACYAMPAAR